MKIQNFTIVISFFCIWLTGYFSQQIQVASAFLLIITFGILHGSNDIVLLNKINQTTVSSSIYKVLIWYILVVLATVLLFYYISGLALLLFIIISSFHFGEQHWHRKLITTQPVFNNIYIFSYGFFILLLLFSLQPNDVIKVIFEISNITISKNFIYALFAVVTALLFLMSLYLGVLHKKYLKIYVIELFYILVFTIIFKMTTLIWGFAIYFIFWHSIPSLIDQVQFLYGTCTANNFILYYKSAFWYWIVSIIGIALLYLTLGKKELFEGLFFSFLAAITFPHVMVIIKMNNKKNNKKINQ